MALGFGSIFADYNAENRAASMGPGAVFYLFCSITYVLAVLFAGFAPTYRLMRSWIAHNTIPLMDAGLITVWGIGVALLSLVISLLICRKGASALEPQ
jgi:ABC-2 type transport system permease protein